MTNHTHTHTHTLSHTLDGGPMCLPQLWRPSMMTSLPPDLFSSVSVFVWVVSRGVGGVCVSCGCVVRVRPRCLPVVRDSEPDSLFLHGLISVNRRRLSVQSQQC